MYVYILMMVSRQTIKQTDKCSIKSVFPGSGMSCIILYLIAPTLYIKVMSAAHVKDGRTCARIDVMWEVFILDINWVQTV